jgi:glycosyltransferase involved in cell wall biosynthesis
MKILILTNKPPYPPKDGGAIAVFQLAKAFAQNGHEISIMAMNTFKHISQNYNHNTNINIEYIKVDTSISIYKAFRNLVFSKMPYNAERFISDEFKERLLSRLKAETFDVIQLEGPYLSYLMPDIRRYSNALVSYRSHNIEHEIWKRTAEFCSNPIKKIYLNSLAGRIKEFERRVINEYDVVVPITQRDCDALINVGCIIPSKVVPVGIDVNELVLKSTFQNHPSICYIGALDWIPNQEGLVWFIDKVWPLVLIQFPNFKFNIAGRNAPTWLENKFKCESITYHGEVDNAHDFIVKHTIQVVPLFSGSGMRVKIIEGMALGMAIVSTTIGAEGINVSHNSNIMLADLPDDFCNNIVSLVNNVDHCKAISEKAMEFVKNNYDSKTLAQDLADFYNNNK